MGNYSGLPPGFQGDSQFYYDDGTRKPDPFHRLVEKEKESEKSDN